MRMKRESRNKLFQIWLETEFDITKEICEVCGGFDPLFLETVYKLPRGNYCYKHIIEEFVIWVNGGQILPKTNGE